MTPKKRLQEALGSATPSESLYELATALRDEGMGQVELYHLFASPLVEAPDDAPADDLYDAICETIDAIWGDPLRFARGYALFERTLSNEMLNGE